MEAIQTPFMKYDSYLYTERPTAAQLEEEKRLAEQAKNFPVKKIPYRGPSRALKFDRPNFYRRGKRSLGAEIGDAGLSFSDFAGMMHLTSRATANDMRLFYTPKFAMNDQQLRLVIAQQGYAFTIQHLPGTKAFFGGMRVPEGFVRNREWLERLVGMAFENHEYLRKHHFHNQCVEQAERYGGYVALRALIAYRAWREAKDAATIADEFGMSWVGVRQILHRLCICALRLGLETFPPHHSNAHQTVENPFKPFERNEEPPDEHLDLTDGVVSALLRLQPLLDYDLIIRTQSGKRLRAESARRTTGPKGTVARTLAAIG
jgi:hypothetical protein